MIISGCWVGYWAFLFFAMTSFAAVHPASLGWSTNTLQSSFGLLRFAFFMVSIFASLLIASFFELWHTDNVVEAWAEFEQTPWMSAKKLLYMLLMIQAVRRDAHHRAAAGTRAPCRGATRAHAAHSCHPPALPATAAGPLPGVHDRGGGLGAAADHHRRLLPRRQEEELHAHVRRRALPLHRLCRRARGQCASRHCRPLPLAPFWGHLSSPRAQSSTAPLLSFRRYLVLVSVTLLLDVLKIATTIGEQKTPGEAFGSFIFFLIFCLKFGIVGAIYMYQKQEDRNPTAFAFSHMPDGERDDEGMIAE